ncbi:MAG: two-component system, NtrC family, sensor kinase [Clostridiales bacterium]|nr:two-component system, NtrC family, sensor kinase [Clostridiales bacterium]MDN5281399.1 two-component system, NtrC family, sensor kinase [Candidatus Ozemobacter sp.]
MSNSVKEGTIFTIPERCRKCYTCVRECPVKAIRVIDGQAKVINDRCIACGNCVKVCSRKAKQVLDSIEHCRALLSLEKPAVAIVAPSAAAEFHDIDREQFVGMLRALGFSRANEVAFGADLVASKYHDLLHQPRSDKKQWIATTCPAVINFVEKYYPEQIDSLAPIVSPMIATARVVRDIVGQDISVVFIGPCTAKKCEGLDEDLEGEIDCVLTFVELRQMLAEDGIDPEHVERIEFDKPWGGTGSLFPIGGGLLQAAEINEDLMAEDVVSINDRVHFVEALKEFDNGNLKVRLLEVLACEGCIMGAGMTIKGSQFIRRHMVGKYARNRMTKMDLAQWKQDVENYKKLDLSRKYRPKDQREENPGEDVINMILAEMGKFSKEDELNCGACGYETCREHALAIFQNLAESEMCLPYTIGELEKAVRELEQSNNKLSTIQEALMHAERLASMGQLAAGIAHEINNPLGVILMYAHLMQENAGLDNKAMEDATMIASQADRCKKIVAGLLNFARENKVMKISTDMNALVDEALRLVQVPYDTKVIIRRCKDNPNAEVDGDQIVQVLTNLISNALAAMKHDGKLEIEVSGTPDKVKISVKDNGHGIPKENMNKLFEPFFTTKQLGKGTGLGLSVTYGIVKMHSGDIRVESNADPDEGPTGTTFSVILPRHGSKDANSNQLLG